MNTETPSSLVLQTLVPKWLMHRTTTAATRRQILTFCIVGACCVTLGYTMSMLYIPGHLTPKGNAGLFDSQLGNNGAQTDLVTHLPLKDDTSSERRPAPMPQPGMPSKDTRPGIFDKFSETISIWNPWGKAQSDRARPYDDEDSVEDFRAGNHTHHQYPRIGKVTILTGRDNQVYERAIRTHELHNQLHGYSFHTLRESLLNGVWSKPAYILSVMLRELAKPKAERLEWLLWIDADTIILNPYIPAGIFLPPPGWDDVHCLVCNDWNGLNNGVFLIRVHSWSVDLLAAVVSYPYYRPDDELLFRDQSAMAELLKTPKFLKHTAIVPQRWFNAYQGEVNETVAPFQVRRGDLLVHFAGVMDRLGRMDYWLTRVEEHDPEWEMELKYTSYPSEIKDYWSDMSRLRNSHRAEVAEARSSMEKLKSDVQKKLDEFRGRVEEVPRKRIEQEIEHADNVLRDPFLGDDVDSIHMTIDILKTISQPLQELTESRNKFLIKECHDVIFKAEQTILGNPASPLTRAQFNELEACISSLKDWVIMKPIDPVLLFDGMNKLSQKHDLLRNRLKDIKAKEEEGRKAKEAAEYVSQNTDTTVDND